MPPYLTKRMLAERYGVTKRTIERMWADGRLPPPVYPLGPQRPYNDLEKIEAAERAAVARPARHCVADQSESEKPAA
jgi:hypothetical protein